MQTTPGPCWSWLFNTTSAMTCFADPRPGRLRFGEMEMKHNDRPSHCHLRQAAEFERLLFPGTPRGAEDRNVTRRSRRGWSGTQARMDGRGSHRADVTGADVEDNPRSKLVDTWREPGSLEHWRGLAPSHRRVSTPQSVTPYGATTPARALPKE